MKIIAAILLLLHALIHALGFLQAFGLTKLTPLSTPPPALPGALWLAASILLLSTVMLWMAQLPYWWMIGGLALLLSQALIIVSWQDAKFGTLPNLLLLGILILGFARNSFIAQSNSLSHDIISTIEPRPSQSDSLATLPPPVQKWLRFSGALDCKEVDWVSIHQELKMKLSPAQKDWYIAKADQVVTLNPPAFAWSVDMRMNALAKVYGHDFFAHGKGSTLMKLWGLFPVARSENNPKTDEAALQRYLAEMAWYPMAATGPAISWEPIDHLSAKATITTNGLKGSGTFYFTEAGEFQQFTAQRYYKSDSDAERIPWVVEVLEREKISGIIVPSNLKVSWELPEGSWRWLEMRVTELQLHTGLNPVY